MYDYAPTIAVAVRRLVGLPRYYKRAFLVINDLLLVSFAVWAAFSLRLNELYVPRTRQEAFVLATAPVIAVLSFHLLGLYKLVTRFLGPLGVRRTMTATVVMAVLWGIVVWFARLKYPDTSEVMLPRSSVILFALISGVLVWGSRQFAAWFLNRETTQKRRTEDHSPIRPVLIYGAGATGVQLLGSLQRSGAYKPVAFIDERPTLWGQRVAGLKVHRPVRIGALITQHNVLEILLAIPEATRARRRTVLRRLEAFKVGVKTLPALEDIAAGRVGISDLRAVTADDLLGRDPVKPDLALLKRCIAGKSVLVTGAGGSIGSELARQILALQPKRLVLLDVSEPALFEIEQGLRSRVPAAQSGRIVAMLGSIMDPALVRRVIETHSVQTIYHAAAYKHVPMVEHNPAVGIANNTFGTRIVAEAAREAGVERFVLVSTDKAVRPTNIMGASKRLAELQLQAMAAEHIGSTVFTMVRFGNVLDSSGSVVGLFRKQIQKGGPVTVTHPDIIRYFMSIPEAAELVIQAGAMANGGDVFVLDMGAAVKIDALARSMIKLVGLTVKDDANPAGDIAIVYTGLRPGEKLFEEPLINEATTTTTEHPRVRRSLEPSLSRDDLERELQSLAAALSTNDLDAIHAVLKRTVEGFTPDKRPLLAAAAAEPGASQAARRTLH